MTQIGQDVPSDLALGSGGRIERELRGCPHDRRNIAGSPCSVAVRTRPGRRRDGCAAHSRSSRVSQGLLGCGLIF